MSTADPEMLPPHPPSSPPEHLSLSGFTHSYISCLLLYSCRDPRREARLLKNQVTVKLLQGETSQKLKQNRVLSEGEFNDCEFNEGGSAASF